MQKEADDQTHEYDVEDQGVDTVERNLPAMDKYDKYEGNSLRNRERKTRGPLADEHI